jgi:gluconokinase
MAGSRGSGAGSEETAMSGTADVEPLEHEPATVIIVVGVSGSGKSTVGQELANSLGVPFVDGDDLHSEENVAKMRAGHPLTEKDRLPWLAALAARVATLSTDRGGVIACSALKRRYRDALKAAAPEVLFLQLALTPETARERVDARSGHFMPSSLVTAQFEDFEPLEPEEPGIALDATGEIDEKVAAFREHLERTPAAREHARARMRGAVRARRARVEARDRAHRDGPHGGGTGGKGTGEDGPRGNGPARGGGH